jgi:hypothetical protein
MMIKDKSTKVCWSLFFGKLLAGMALSGAAVAATNLANPGFESINFGALYSLDTSSGSGSISLAVTGSNYQNGQWLESLSSDGSDNKHWTFVGNGDGTFIVHPTSAQNLCLTHKQSGGTHTYYPGANTVDANNPWSWVGGSSYVLHATINNCDGSSDQAFFVQKTGDKNSYQDRSQEHAYLIRSKANPADCLNIEGGTGSGHTVVWYNCQWTGNKNDRWMPQVQSFSSTNNAAGYNNDDSRILAHWADMYAVARGTGSQPAMQIGTITNTANTASPFTTISLNSSSTAPTYTTGGGTLLPFFDPTVGNFVPYFNNTTGGNSTRNVTTSRAQSVQTTLGFKETVGYKFTQKTTIVGVSETSNEFSLGFEASQQLTNTTTDTTTISYMTNTPNNSAFWLALGTSGTISATNAIWDVYNDVGDHSVTDVMTANISFGSASGVSYCGTGSLDPACIATKPANAL